MSKILKRSFYQRNTIQIAQELLGKLLVRQIGKNTLAGIIVETEAYIRSDPACHAFRGKTESNQALFGPVGHTYIYFIYGNHFCVNVVAHSKEQCAGGVLIRALEPVQGIELMQQHRKANTLKNLTNGPGKLAQALQITKELYGQDLTKQGPLYLSEGISISEKKICYTPRIGISKAQENLWRFYICDNDFVSRG